MQSAHKQAKYLQYISSVSLEERGILVLKYLRKNLNDCAKG